MPIDFLLHVKDTVSRLKREYGWTQDGDAFAHWAIGSIMPLTERDAYSEGCVGSKDDRAVDGFYVDHDRRRVDIFQCKYQEAVSSFGDRSALADFLKVPHRLLDEKLSSQFKNAEIRRCARRYRDAVKEGYDVKLNFVAFGNPTPSVLEEASLALRTLPTNHELVFWSFKKLEDLYTQQIGFDEPITETVPLTLANTERLSMQTAKAQAIVVNIPGEQIYNLRKKYGRRLFTRDVRYFLGETPINKQIARTLGLPSDRQFFWYYNNGISISCTNYSLDEANNMINIVNPQVINGCQTAESIFNFGEKNGVHNLKTVSILARVIKTTDKLVGQNITARTNTQNPQSARNLCANLESQTSLKQLFDDMNPPVFFETKDGEWDGLPDFRSGRYLGRDGKPRFVDNARAASAYMAFARDDELNPVEARRKHTDVFDITKPYYEQIFPEKPRSPYEYLVPYLFLGFVEDKLKEVRKALSTASPSTDEELAVQEVRGSVRYAKWFVMGLVGWLMRQYYGKPQLDEDVSTFLYPALGDFSGPSPLAKYAIDLSTDMIESYTENKLSENEDFDAALAYRQSVVWKDLKRRALRRYQRLVEKGEFHSDLFPTPTK